jgi:hypothetical protein
VPKLGWNEQQLVRSTWARVVYVAGILEYATQRCLH